MGIETYILIAICYGVGCRLSWQLGVRHGTDFTLRTTVQEISEISDKTTLEIFTMIKEHRKAKREKALKATRS